jgi:Zn-dependent peptidase ImmA (M78 family)
MIHASAYYEQMRELARTKRLEYEVETKSLTLIVLGHIFRKEGVRIDRRDLKGHRIRAAYFCDEGDASVMVKRSLPAAPKLFCLVHELKHHFVDRPLLEGGVIRCGDYNANKEIEIGAEEFAAEFIYPENEFLNLMGDLGLTAETCNPTEIVKFKKACPANISYLFIVKRFERRGLCRKDEYAHVQFQKLEEKIFGVPFYKQDWFKRHRARKAMRTSPS